MDIGSGNGYPAAALSNFSPHPFVFDGVECSSAEGLLQSFKSPYPHVQVEICKLVGRAAKKRGSKIDWKKDQTLYWKGVPFKRDGDEYQQLLDGAFEALSGNTSFQAALLATGNANLTHTIGKSSEKDTVLTIREFCSRLEAIRSRLQAKK